MKKIYFKKGMWEENFVYAYCPRFPFSPEFVQKNGYIENSVNPDMRDGFDYVTALLCEKYESVKLTLECSFEKYGAPLITIAEDVFKNEEGNLIYKNYHEVVLWEGGINIWHLKDEEGSVKIKKLAALDFPLEGGKRHTFSAEIVKGGIKAVCGSYSFYVAIPTLPEKFYAGITGCENINKFYSLEIEEKNK